MPDRDPAPTYPRAALEDYLRDYYFEATVDISSSGVEPYSMREVRDRTGLDLESLDKLDFRDSRSAGADELRALIATRFFGGDPSRILVTNGSSEALHLAMGALLRPDDEVVIQDPAYHSLGQLIEALGCRTRRWRLPAHLGFRCDVDELRDLVDAGVRAVVVGFPHNPTGATVTPREQAEIVDAARSAGAWLLWDAAFGELTYDEPPLPDIGPDYERAVTFGTLSKAYGLPGLRVGWLDGPAELVEACVAMRDYTTLALSPLVECVAGAAIAGADALLAPRLAQARANRELLGQWATAQGHRVMYTPARGGVTAFPGLRDIADVDGLCHSLMRDSGVLLVPGSCFGFDSHVRLGFGGHPAHLAQALDRLGQALAGAATT